MQIQNEFVQISKSEKFNENEFYALIAALDQRKQQSILPVQIDISPLPSQVDKNIITRESEPLPNCLTCGACCTYLLCLTVRPSDKTPSNHFWNITTESKRGEIVVDRFLRRNDETFACTALNGRLGESVCCQIYENRPAVCREFEAGSDKCHAIRRAFGIESQLTEETVLEAQFRFELYKERQAADYQILYAQIISLDQLIEDKDRAIIALFKNETTQVVHLYNSNQETYFQSEFAGLNITEALELINSRKQTQKQNL